VPAWLEAICAEPAFGSTYDTGSLLTEKYPHPRAMWRLRPPGPDQQRECGIEGAAPYRPMEVA
jgi:hypothetical protein